MIKKTFTALLLITLNLFLCSCTSNYSKDVHFVHAVCLDANINDGTYEILTVCEKQSGDKGGSEKEKDYFLCVESEKSFDRALDKLIKKYTNSYYASNTIYFLRDFTDEKTLNEIAVFISKSNILPSKAQAVIISNTEPYDLLCTIKSQEDIKKIIKLTSSKKTNIIRFLADSNNEKLKNQVPHLTLSKNKKNIELFKKQ